MSQTRISEAKRSHSRLFSFQRELMLPESPLTGNALAEHAIFLLAEAMLHKHHQLRKKKKKRKKKNKGSSVVVLLRLSNAWHGAESCGGARKVGFLEQLWSSPIGPSCVYGQPLSSVSYNETGESSYNSPASRRKEFPLRRHCSVTRVAW